MAEQNPNPPPDEPLEFPSYSRDPTPVSYESPASGEDARAKFLFRVLHYADLTRTAKWIIRLMIVLYAMVIIGVGLIEIATGGKPGPVELPGALALVSFGSICFGVIAGFVCIILTFTWFYKSARNLRMLPDSGYPYSPGLTLGLMFIPYYHGYWTWRVLRQEAEALIRVKTAKGMEPGPLKHVPILMNIFVAHYYVSLAASCLLFLIVPQGAPDAGEAVMRNPAVIFVRVIFFLFGLVALYGFLRSMWDISVVMRDLAESVHPGAPHETPS